MTKKPFILLSFLLFSCLISLVHAETFQFTELPTYVDNQLGCGTFIAGLLVSMVFFTLILLPIVVLTKGKQFSLYIIVGLIVLAPLVALGWFSAWIMILIVLAIAVGMGQKIADYLGGLRR